MKITLPLIVMLAISTTFTTTQTANAKVGENNLVLDVERVKQSDKLCLNFVDDFSKKMYKAILNGDIKLYENSTKKFVIKPSSLLNFEKKTKNNFLKCHELWVYENWHNNIVNIATDTKGLAFVSRGEYIDVMFGFVDYEDVQRLLKNYYPAVDARGYSNINLLSFISNKLYDYRILKFNKRDINSKMASNHLKRKFLQSTKSDEIFASIKKAKQIRYDISRTDIIANAEENMVLKSFETYLINNPEALLNLGGSKYYNYIGDINSITPDVIGEKLKVTGMRVNEVWEMNANGELITKPIGVSLIINNETTLSEIEFSEIAFMDNELHFDNGYMTKFLKNKGFIYHINKINNQVVNDVVKEDRILVNSLKIPGFWGYNMES